MIVALIAGLVFAVLTPPLLASRGTFENIQAGDFTYPWRASRALLQRIDPYVDVRSMREPWTPTLFYPISAALVSVPLAPFPARLAAALLVGLGMAWLAFAVTARWWWPLVMLLSAPAYQVAKVGQWAPLLMAASLTAPAVWLITIKPNLAFPLLASQTSARAIVWCVAGGCALLILGVILVPAWPQEWLATFGAPVAAQYRAPMLLPYGAPLTLAALRWRRADARLLFAMAITPQNFFFYDQFALFLVPSTKREYLVLALTSWLAYYGRPIFGLHGSAVTLVSAQAAPFVVLGLYLPALVMVLRRPNTNG